MSIGSVTHLSKYMSHTVKNIWTSETFWIRSSSNFTNPCGNLYVPTFMIDGLDWWWNHPPQYCAPGESCPVPLNLLIRHLALTIFVTTQIDMLSVPSFTWKVGNQDMPNWSKFTNLNWRNKSGFIESSTIRYMTNTQIHHYPSWEPYPSVQLLATWANYSRPSGDSLRPQGTHNCET